MKRHLFPSPFFAGLLLLTGFSCLEADAQVVGRVRPQTVPSMPGRAEGEEWPENYVLKLTIADKGETVTEFSVVLATGDFNSTFLSPDGTTVTLTGNAVLKEDGSFRVRYGMGSEVPVPAGDKQVQYRTVSTQAAVQLKAGEPVEIERSNTRTWTLSITRLAEQGKEKPAATAAPAK